LAHLCLDNVVSLARPITLPITVTLNLLWSAGGILTDKARLNWSGFTQTVCDGEHPPASKIAFLPIVNLQPTDETCVHSTLAFISTQAEFLNITTPCVTFDQPLFIKALDIVLAEKMNIIVRLGGFHIMSSFLGSIGYMMRGSGLEDLLGVLYGKNVVETILQGKDYKRAVRGHFLIHSALNNLLLDVLLTTDSDDCKSKVNLTDSDGASLYRLDSRDVSIIQETFKRITEDKLRSESDETENNLHSSSTHAMYTKYNLLQRNLSTQSRTSRLWILYMAYVDILKQFILSERTSNWLLHLDCLHRMYAATGHENYAKSVRVYLQFMQRLPDRHPDVYNHFVSGFHTIRRSNRFWDGLSCDLVIEQTLMRSIKGRSGLTHGRGVDDSVRTVWLKTMAECERINMSMSQLLGLDRGNVEHKEFGNARTSRDTLDMQKLTKYFILKSPFRFIDSERLISLISGVSAGPDDWVTCDTPDEVGFEIQQSWDGKTYAEVQLHKAAGVRTCKYAQFV
jgi:hypothetical protein